MSPPPRPVLCRYPGIGVVRSARPRSRPPTDVANPALDAKGPHPHERQPPFPHRHRLRPLCAGRRRCPTGIGPGPAAGNPRHRRAGGTRRRLATETTRHAPIHPRRRRRRLRPHRSGRPGTRRRRRPDLPTPTRRRLGRMGVVRVLHPRITTRQTPSAAGKTDLARIRTGRARRLDRPRRHHVGDHRDAPPPQPASIRVTVSRRLLGRPAAGRIGDPVVGPAQTRHDVPAVRTRPRHRCRRRPAAHLDASRRRLATTPLPRPRSAHRTATRRLAGHPGRRPVSRPGTSTRETGR